MFNRFRLLLITTLATAVIATPAAATVYLATWTGTLLSGYDGQGIFAAQKADLAGLAFDLKITIDDATPLEDLRVFPALRLTELFGGVAAGNTAQPMSAALTINGITRNITSSVGSFAEVLDNQPSKFDGYDIFSLQVGGRDKFVVNNKGGGVQIKAQTKDFSFLDGYSFATPINNVAVDGIATGLFSITDKLESHGVFAPARLSFATVSSDVGAVPEPATWIMLVAGFGLTGAAARRQLQIVAA